MLSDLVFFADQQWVDAYVDKDYNLDETGNPLVHKSALLSHALYMRDGVVDAVDTIKKSKTPKSKTITYEDQLAMLKELVLNPKDKVNSEEKQKLTESFEKVKHDLITLALELYMALSYGAYENLNTYIFRICYYMVQDALIGPLPSTKPETPQPPGAPEDAPEDAQKHLPRKSP